MTIALGAQVDRMLSAMSEDNEFSVFIFPEQKERANNFTDRFEQ
jgi:hypothetical protein